MFTTLIAQPITRESEIKRPPPKRLYREHTRLTTETQRTKQILHNAISDEERYLIKLIVWFFVVFVLPAMLTLLYIIANPDAFMIDVTPTIDFSSWQPTARP